VQRAWALEAPIQPDDCRQPTTYFEAAERRHPGDSRGDRGQGDTDNDELRKNILGRLVENMYKRSKLFNMEIPFLDQMAKDAGVSLRRPWGRGAQSLWRGHREQGAMMVSRGTRR
jgi:hypothetical protein